MTRPSAAAPSPPGLPRRRRRAARASAPTARRARAQRDEEVVRQGLVFGVGDEHRPFAVDLVPRVLGAARVGRARGGPHPAGLGGSSRSSATSTARSGSSTTASCPRDVVTALPRLAGRSARGCRRTPSARRSWASTSSATSTAAGGSWRTTCASPSGAGLRRRRPRPLDAVMPDLPRPAGTGPPGRRLRAAPHALLAHAAAGTGRRCSPAARRLGLVRAPPPRRGRRARCWSRPTTSHVADGRVVAPRRRRPRSACSTCGWTASSSTSRTRRPADRRRDRGRRRRRAASSWPTPPATGSPTTSRPIPSCPS